MAVNFESVSLDSAGDVLCSRNDCFERLRNSGRLVLIL
jgi:hypothetical protein